LVHVRRQRENPPHKLSREILQKLDEAKIEIASSTYDIVGMPPLRIVQEDRHVQHA